MFGNRLSDHRTAAGNDIQHPGGQAGFRRQRGKFEGGPGSQLAGLDYDGAACGQHERQSFGEDEEREVPGRDQTHYPDRLAGDETEQVVTQVVEAVALQGPRQASGVLPDAGCGDHFATGLGNGLAGLQGFAQRQVIAALPDQGCDTQQHRSPGLAGQARPAPIVECAPCGGHRSIDIRSRTGGVAADSDVMSRAVAQDVFSAGACAPCSVDEHAVLGNALRQFVGSSLAVVVVVHVSHLLFEPMHMARFTFRACTSTPHTRSI
ncbi:hypothetical protein D9M68_308170 [compost metagenome]